MDPHTVPELVCISFLHRNIAGGWYFTSCRSSNNV